MGPHRKGPRHGDVGDGHLSSEEVHSQRQNGHALTNLLSRGSLPRLGRDSQSLSPPQTSWGWSTLCRPPVPASGLGGSARSPVPASRRGSRHDPFEILLPSRLLRELGPSLSCCPCSGQRPRKSATVAFSCVTPSPVLVRLGEAPAPVCPGKGVAWPAGAAAAVTRWDRSGMVRPRAAVSSVPWFRAEPPYPSLWGAQPARC